MQIYEVLKKDHEKIKGLLARLVGSADATDKQRKELISEIRDELIPHSRAEEAVFYNSLRDLDVSKDIANHGYREHMEAETLLRTLQGMDAVGADWTMTAKKLKDAIEHHIDEEEGKMFEAGRQLFIDEEAEMMAEAFERIKPEVQEEGFMQTTLDMVANMMPERLAQRLRSFRLNP